MQVTKKNKSETEVELNVVLSSDELQSMKQHVLGHFVDKLKLPGFRSGKAPLSLVEKNVDPASLQSEFLEEAIGTFYRQAIGQEKLRAVDQPVINIKKFVPFTTLEFEATVSVVSPVKLPDYMKIKVPKKDIKVTAEDVLSVVKSLAKRMAERKTVDRPAKNGDELTIDFSGSDVEGKAISGADGKDYPLTLGSNAFIPGFEENLVGLKVGEEKTFRLKFPKDYGVKALASKNVDFKVKVNQIQELLEPKVDDSFASKAGPFKTLSELKADIKKQLTIEKQNEANKQYESELVKAITDKSSVSIPPLLVDDTVDRMLQDVKQNLAYRGQTYPEFLEAESITEEQHRKELEPSAYQRVKASLVLAEIADKENLDVTAEELEAKIQALKSQYKDEAMQAELDKPENRRDIASRMLTEKTLDLLTT